MYYTKEEEYLRSIELFKEVYDTKGLMLALYLLADSGYNNEDLYNMAKLLEDVYRQ